MGKSSICKNHASLAKNSPNHAITRHGYLNLLCAMHLHKDLAIFSKQNLTQGEGGFGGGKPT